MLPSLEELGKNFELKSTEDLLRILKHSKNYRKEAIYLVEKELSKRNVIISKSKLRKVKSYNPGKPKKSFSLLSVLLDVILFSN